MTDPVLRHDKLCNCSNCLALFTAVAVWNEINDAPLGVPGVSKDAPASTELKLGGLVY